MNTFWFMAGKLSLWWFVAFFILCSGIFYFLKRENLPANSTTASIPAYESDEFLQFYNQFGADSLFQLEHIVFPLEGTAAARDSMPPSPPDFRWQKEHWTIHKAYNDMDGTFTRQFMSVGNIISEIIADKSNQFSMERRFAKMDGQWYLIYYREMGIY
jgi:hypothetical protein